MVNISQGIKHALCPVKFAEEALGWNSLDDWQKQVLQAPERQMILLCSRQAGKSQIVAIKAVYTALHYPDSLTLVISASQRQSSELFRTITREFNKLNTQPRMIEDNRLSLTLQSGARICALPSVGSTIRGFSNPRLVLLDEAARINGNIYQAIRPMLATSPDESQLILLSTPAGREGFFYETWHSESEHWRKIKVLAKDVPRISQEFLDQELETLGRWYYSQEYEVEFNESETAVFRLDDIMAAISTEISAKNLMEGDQNGDKRN